MVKWDYEEFDINEMMILCFDYIRGRYEGKDFRKISKPSAKDSVFCRDKKLWKSFLEEHNQKVSSIQEKSVDELRKEYPNEDMSKILEARDKDWETKATGFIEEIGEITKARLNFVVTNKKSYAYGQTQRDDVPILDAKTYESAFDKIENAIFIRLSN